MTKENTNKDYIDILEYNPNWFVKWGVTIIAVIVLIMIFLSAYIKQPDILKSKYNFSGFILKDSSHRNTEIKFIRVFVDVNDIERISKGKKIGLQVISDGIPRVFNCEGDIDSVVFDCDKIKYSVIVKLTTKIPDNLKNEFIKMNDIMGDVNVILAYRSLFDRIFGKYVEFKK